MNLNENNKITISQEDVVTLSSREDDVLRGNFSSGSWSLVFRNENKKIINVVDRNSLELLEFYLNQPVNKNTIDAAHSYTVYHTVDTSVLSKAIGVDVHLRTQKRKFVIDSGFNVINEMYKRGIHSTFNGLTTDEFKEQLVGVAKNVFGKDFSGTNGHFDTDSIDSVMEYLTWLNVGMMYDNQTKMRPLRPKLYVNRRFYDEILLAYGLPS